MAMWQTAKRGGGARAGLRKVLSVFLAATVMGALIFSALAPVVSAETGNSDVSWFGNHGGNPHGGSKWTFEYYGKETGGFQKLEFQKDKPDDSAADPSGYYQDKSGKVYFNGWIHTATDSLYVAVAFNADFNGKVKLRADRRDDTITGSDSSGQFMLLQKSASGYHVLKDWVDISAGQDVKIDPVDTYVKANDVVYFLFRSVSDSTATADLQPGTEWESDVEDTEGLYPKDWVELSEALGVQSEVVEQEVVEQDISWFVKQSKQPWEGSYFTFDYYDTDSKTFKQMEKYVPVDEKNPGKNDDDGWQDESGKATIMGWKLWADNTRYAAVAFNATSDGKVALTRSFTAKGTDADGQFMLLQKSSDKYNVLHGWVNIPVGQTVSIPDTSTYVKAGDVVYYIFRSSGEKTAAAEITTPSVSYTIGAEDTEGLYPDKWVELSEALGAPAESGSGTVTPAEVWEYDITWYVQQDKQPWEGSYYTFEYYDAATETFKKMETHRSDMNPAFWEDESGRTQIKGWQQTATNTRYAAVAFNAASDGKVALTRGFTIKGAGADSQFMLLQKSADGYRALQGWVNIPVGQTVTVPDVSTYVKAGDVVYYLYRSTKETIAIGDMIPKVKYEIGAADTEGLYPAQWVTLAEALNQSNPATGDTAPVGFAVAVALFAAAAAVVCLPRRGARRKGGK